jgi:hypothetical protein
MAQALRQSELFAGNDWLALYRAFTEVNLNAFDFASIRASMVEYIRRNYPEDFNDWIESSEFVAIIDLLSYLGQSLAFRTDINARENFLDVARRRESVLRLARSLSYNAKRAYPARGLVKLVEIKTSEDVYDSSGRNLNNVTIRWDDANNPNWFEQWVLVLNSTLVGTNPFGMPLKQEAVLGVQTQLYRLNNIPVTAGNFSYSASVNNRQLSFDIVNPDFDSLYGFTEQAPNPSAAFNVIYRSDGNGNASPDTGFFLYTKQGTLQRNDYLITAPQENRTILIDTANINETDIWVQSVDDSGAVIPSGEWTRIGHVPTDEITKVLLTTENVTYNGVDPDVQQVYQAVTQDNGQVLLRFGDGRFGQSPVGNLRVWYRVSNDESLTVRPDDIRNMQISIPYTTQNGLDKRVTLTFTLQESISNATASETNDDIRRRAGLVYSTQGRMVSGADYNSLPTQTNLAAKLKAVNRVYSGQSRFIDLNDPTGTYQNTNVVADDGAIYQEDDPQIIEVVRATTTSTEMLDRYLTPLVESISLRDLVLDKHYQNGAVYKDTFNTSYLGDADLYQAIYGRIELGQTFGLGFNFNSGKWYMMASEEMATTENMFAGQFPPYDYNSNLINGGPNSWLIYVEYGPDFWRLYGRGLAYVFESKSACKFFFVNQYSTIDPQTGKAGYDKVTLFKKANGLDQNLTLTLEKPYIYSDGYQEPNRVRVRFYDSNADGQYDYPDTYYQLHADQGVVVHQLIYTTDGYSYQRLISELASEQEFPLKPNEYGFINTGGGVNLLKGQENNINVYIADGNQMLLLPIQPGTLFTVGTEQFTTSHGANQLVYQWKHFAPSDHRIDPAVTNIIDIFVLTNDYLDAMDAWRDSGANPQIMPVPPSELNLRQTFAGLEEFKMFSDEIIWRPVSFKLLFGSNADPVVQAKLKVVKLDGAVMSDGEIKSQVVQSVRDFFSVNMWDFGETFYFSELGAYIHRQLSTSISSVEIVPTNGTFGQLREIRCLPDELFFSTLEVQDVDIITANTPTNLRIR